MRLGDPIKPTSQPIDTGTIVRLFQCPTNGDPSPIKGDLKATVGKILHASKGANIIAIENGFGVCTSNAETTWAKKGGMLRKAVRIDKCPWPDGQASIKIVATLTYTQGVGGLGTTSFGTTSQQFIWNRNTILNFNLSAFAPDNIFQQGFGFNGGSGSCRFELSCHGFDAGLPLVQNDGNPYSNTYVQLVTSNPTWPYPPTWQIAGFGDSSTMTCTSKLPCPQWANQQIFFPGGPYFFEGASYIHGAIGLVMSMDWTVDVVGTPGFNPFAGIPDPASWPLGKDDDDDVYTLYEGTSPIASISDLPSAQSAAQAFANTDNVPVEIWKEDGVTPKGTKKETVSPNPNPVPPYAP